MRQVVVARLEQAARIILRPIWATAVLVALVGLAGCRDTEPGDAQPGFVPGDGYELGPNGGRMLRDGKFAIELALVETIAPEFRAWAMDHGAAIDPREVDLSVLLARLGGRVDEHSFDPAGPTLRGTPAVAEPHSFSVTVIASHNGREHQWEYESFEGRTEIGALMAAELGIGTEVVGPGVIDETATLYGRIVPEPGRVRDVSARFDGPITEVHAMPGDRVEQGQLLATVESNESLQAYAVRAPIAGVVAERLANAGEQTAGRNLFTIVDTSTVWAELSVFPGDRDRIVVGTGAKVTPATGGVGVDGTISYIAPFAAPDQSVAARVALDNSTGVLTPGMVVNAKAKVASHEVPLAVRRAALQSFGDFTVVYAQFGDQYEVRMLELGRAAGDWVEVLGGIEAGTVYVTENSYVVKADIEKDGAAHHH